MAKQRYINTKFWDDTYIITLDPIEKLLFIYFLTNPLTNICGGYEMNLRRASLDTGIDEQVIKTIIGRFSAEGKIFFIDGWVIIRNFIKHQSDGMKIMAGIRLAINEIPSQIRERVKIAYGYDMDELLDTNTNTNNNSNTNSNSKSLDTFQEFWAAYPNKKAKAVAQKSWEKINPDPKLFAEIMSGLEKAKKSSQWVKNDGQYIPHPATWLNQQRWNDEVEVKKQSISVTI